MPDLFDNEPRLSDDKYIAHRKSEDLYHRSRLGSYFYIIGITVCALNDSLYFNAPFEVATAVLYFIFITLFRYFQSPPPKNTAELVKWQRISMTLSLLGSFGWGIAFAWVTSHPELINTLQSMVVCTVALSTAVAYQFSLFRLFAQIGCLFFIAPAVLTIIFIQPDNIVLAIVLSIYGLYLVLAIVQRHREYLATLQIEIGLLDAKNNLKQLSLVDELTGLANRRHFRNHLDSLTKFALILVDVDHFKQVNDNYGHHVGDQCLVHVANVLKQSCNRAEDLVARIGGEEFAIVLADSELEPAVDIATAIKNTLGQKKLNLPELSEPIKLTASFGVACMSDNEQQPVNLIFKRADELLYKAKEAGRNCVKF